MLRPKCLESDRKSCRSQITPPPSGPTSFRSGRLCNTRLRWKLPQSESRLNSHCLRPSDSSAFPASVFWRQRAAERTAVPLTVSSCHFFNPLKVTDSLSWHSDLQTEKRGTPISGTLSTIFTIPEILTEVAHFLLRLKYYFSSFGARSASSQCDNTHVNQKFW